MERLVSSLSVRLISVVLVILAALVPPLYLGVSAIVRDGYAERFVNSLRAYSRLVADELEAIDGPDFERRALAVLDSAVLSGQVVFAEVRDDTHTLRSTIATPVYAPPRDDFHFGDQGDQIYFITHTVNRRLRRGAHTRAHRGGTAARADRHGGLRRELDRRGGVALLGDRTAHGAPAAGGAACRGG